MLLGDVAVDPVLREVRVTFSKDMQTHEMWSFALGSEGPQPGLAGRRWIPGGEADGSRRGC